MRIHKSSSVKSGGWVKTVVELKNGMFEPELHNTVMQYLL
jgi:hypothetical protein